MVIAPRPATTAPNSATHDQDLASPERGDQGCEGSGQERTIGAFVFVVVSSAWGSQRRSKASHGSTSVDGERARNTFIGGSSPVLLGCCNSASNFTEIWGDMLPPTPQDIWDSNLAHVKATLIGGDPRDRSDNAVASGHTSAERSRKLGRRATPTIVRWRSRFRSPTPTTEVWRRGSGSVAVERVRWWSRSA